MARRLVFKTDLDTYTADTTPIGQGGSGRVYLANGSDGQTYAVKVMDPQRVTSLKERRFTNELNFGRRVRHDHVVPVLDSGLIEIGGKSTPFFVMPNYGSSLRALIVSGLAPDRALGLFDGLVAGLDFAHSRSIWHRDIKPENILYDEATGRLLLADFGIAHFEEDDLHTAVETKDAERLANFMYAAPEQRERGATVDQRADIYAAGLILNEMITGRVPLGTGYRRVADVSGRYSYVDSVVERAIRANPDDRYPSIADLREDLTLLSAGSGLSVARSVGARVTAAAEKERLFWSEDGVQAIRRKVGEIYDYIEPILARAAKDFPPLEIQYERSEHEIIVRTKRTSARINWYQMYSNTLSEARLTIWPHKWRLLLPSERGRFLQSVKPVEVSEHIFRPDYTAADGLCWLDEDSGRHLTVTAVGDRLIEIFFDLVNTHETSNEQAF